MKGQLLASVAVVALIVAGPATAADLPLKAPPKALWTWSGFYLGAHAGYGWSRDPLSSVDDPFFFGKFPGFGPVGFDGKGWLGGFHAGANWQDGKIVGGLEIDLSATDINGSSTRTAGPVLQGAGGPFPNIVNGSATNSGKFEWLGSARGRLGVLATPDIMLYGTGGLAWTHYRHDEALVTTRNFFAQVPPVTDGTAAFNSYANWRFGWVAGIGGEMRLFNSNWLGRLEYLHYDFGPSDTNLVPMYYGGPWPRTGGHLTADVIRAGLSYKFDPDRFALGYTGWGGGAAPVRYAKAPVAPLAWTWAGFYLGAHGGYGWADDPFTRTPALLLGGQVAFPQLAGVKSSGWVAGFHAGANWQSRSMVGGLELDISATDINGATSNTAGVVRVTQFDKLDPVGSVRARLGYLVTPDVLLYGTGGLGWTQFSTTTSYAPGFVPASLPSQSWRFGWVAGGGVEARLGNSNWLGRIEYLHYDFGTSGSLTGNAFAFNPPLATSVALSSGRLTADVVRAGLSYKLNWPDPAGAGGRSVIIAKAVAPAVWSWSGFYLGGHAGYGWADDRARIMVQPAGFGLGLVPTLVGGVQGSGYVAGFQAGGNWQSGSFVGGLEIDLSAAGIKGTSTAAGFDALGGRLTGVLSDNIDLLGSVRARLGYLVRPDILLYGTGGLAWTHLDQTLTNTAPNFTYTAVTPTWRSGWVAGVGGQMRLWNSNWIGRLEYLHYDFGRSDSANQSFIDPNEPTGVGITRLDRAGRLTTDVVRVGLDYKFD